MGEAKGNSSAADPGSDQSKLHTISAMKGISQNKKREEGYDKLLNRFDCEKNFKKYILQSCCKVWEELGQRFKGRKENKNNE